MWSEGLYFGGFELIIINDGNNNDICRDMTCWSCVVNVITVDKMLIKDDEK